MPLKLVQMSDRRARDSVAVLTVLLDKAKRGELEGLAIAARMSNGEEDIMFTDWYRRQVGRASNAASRMYWRAMQMQDDADRNRNAG